MLNSPYLFVRAGNRYVRVKLPEIRYIEASRNYCRIHLPGRYISVLATLQQLEGELAPSGFVRIHRGFLVSLPHVTAFDRQTLQVEGGKLPVGDHYYPQLMRRVTILGEAGRRLQREEMSADPLRCGPHEP